MAPVTSSILALLLTLPVVLAGGPTPAPAIDTSTLSRPGAYATEVREVLVRRPGSAGGDFPARLYIPLPRHDDTAAPPGHGSPVVAFGHGFLSPVELYHTTLDHLASWGITVIAPRSGGELFPDHRRFATDLVASVDWVVAQAAGDGDWTGLPVDPVARGVSGHSMGGGAALLAAAGDPRIRAVATLAAAETRPSAIDSATTVSAATLFIAASDDAITPVDVHQRPMYEAASMAPAQLRIIEGGSHCGFVDVVILAGFICDETSIDGAEQRAQSRAALTAWFLAELSRDERVAAVAWPAEGSGDGVSVESKGHEASS